MSTTRPKGQSLAVMLLLVALLAPTLLLVAVCGARLGVWSADFSLGVLALKAGRVLAYLGLAAALAACLMALRERRLLGIAGAALAIAGVTLGGYLIQERRFTDAPRDVATDPSEPPAFARILAAERRLAGVPETRPQTCEGLLPAPTQVAPETAAWALEKAGFTVLGTSPFRVDGRKEGAWFGVTHDVTVRIRPGRTDVRVAGRDNLQVGDEACRLAKAVVAALTP
ncbi:DUF1499 domain-containing protein [Brevundimonas sp.]|uniref:DUF1499 domain-containing protein n=1 Tax=Brevundimonas sp. TaxID=1871086 RepID=UPI0028B21897|nr:DUF1499 domain-containing protein [Brevundimonas sp.]